MKKKPALKLSSSLFSGSGFLADGRFNVWRHKSPQRFSPSRFLITIGLSFIIAACGAQNASTPTSALPTATTIPTFSFTQPTEAPQVATAAATLASAQTSELDPVAVERGRGRYDALECAACHGDNAEGTDFGSSLIESTINEADFIAFMRSGGGLGSLHQYSTNRLSDSGGKNLYQYMLSIRESE